MSEVDLHTRLRGMGRSLIDEPWSDRTENRNPLDSSHHEAKDEIVDLPFA